MARFRPFGKKSHGSDRRPAERIEDLRIIMKDFTLINGEATFRARGGKR